MSDKIIITDNELGKEKEAEEAPSSPKMILYEVPVSPSEEDVSTVLSWGWYAVFLLPLVNLLAVGWMFSQKKHRLGHPLLCLAFCVFSLLLFGWCLWGINASDNWKNRLGERARKGVVMIDAEDRGWFLNETMFGTGMVVAKDGDRVLILTNRHVVTKSNGQMADALQVRDCHEQLSVARVVALPMDPGIDMALICIRENPDLEVLGDIGDYEKLQAGDDVVAIGHPSGLNFTMTEGIVSGLRKDLLIQSSALINPGNSGGPLLNRNGQIIGVNTFCFKDCPGLNFAFRADFMLCRHAWNYFANISDLLDAVTVQ